MKIRRRARRGEADISTIPIIPLSLAVFAVALVMVLMGQTPPQLFGWALLLLPLPWLPLGAWIAARTRLPFTAFLLLSTFIGFAFSPLLMALVRLISPAALPLFIASLLCNLASALLLKRPSAPKPRLPRKIAFSSTAALFIILFAFYITLPLWGAGQDNPRADLLKPITERNPDRTFTKLFTMDYLGRVSYISELARGGLPPRVPYLAAERFPFHWFWFLIAADLSTLAGASAFFMNKLLPVACIVLFLATLYHAARYFEKNTSSPPPYSSSPRSWPPTSTSAFSSRTSPETYHGYLFFSRRETRKKG